MRTLIGILGCHSRAEYRNAQRETWLKHVSFDYRYFLGHGKTTPKLDETILDCPDDYNSLLLKTVKVVEWALEKGYDSLFKTDDDTIVNPSRLKDWRSLDYAGQSQDIDCLGIKFCSGGGYWLSRKAMKSLLDASNQLRYVYRHGPESGYVLRPEDQWVGRALHEQKIKPTHSTRCGDKNDVLGDFVAKWEYTPEEMKQEWERHGKNRSQNKD